MLEDIRKTTAQEPKKTPKQRLHDTLSKMIAVVPSYEALHHTLEARKTTLEYAPPEMVCELACAVHDDIQMRAAAAPLCDAGWMFATKTIWISYERGEARSGGCAVNPGAPGQHAFGGPATDQDKVLIKERAMNLTPTPSEEKWAREQMGWSKAAQPSISTEPSNGPIDKKLQELEKAASVISDKLQSLERALSPILVMKEKQVSVPAERLSDSASRIELGIESIATRLALSISIINDINDRCRL